MHAFQLGTRFVFGSSLVRGAGTTLINVILIATLISCRGAILDYAAESRGCHRHEIDH